VIDQLKAKNGQVEVIERDLDKYPPGHITGAHVGAFYTPAEKLTAEQKNLLLASDQYISDLMAADILGIGTPMLNFNVPSVLKAWIDHVVRVNKTFSFAGGSLQSLVQNKKCYLALSSGSFFLQVLLCLTITKVPTCVQSLVLLVLLM
jgi:FMN-dependent NADH-azoreductase